MIEVLASLIFDDPLAVPVMTEPEKSWDMRQNILIIAINLAALTEPALFK